VPLLNLTLELDLGRNSHHFKMSTWRYNSADGGLKWMTFSKPMLNDMSMQKTGSNVNFVQIARNKWGHYCDNVNNINLAERL